MRDQRFVAVHRGGKLSLENHRLLMRWACDCAEHVALLSEAPLHETLQQALRVARAWQHGQATTGAAMAASRACHKYARTLTTPVDVAVARAIGHAVATAHAADHSLGPVWYGLKAVKAAGRDVATERAWQDEQIPLEVRELVLSARESPKFARR